MGGLWRREGPLLLLLPVSLLPLPVVLLPLLRRLSLSLGTRGGALVAHDPAREVVVGAGGTDPVTDTHCLLAQPRSRSGRGGRLLQRVLLLRLRLPLLARLRQPRRRREGWLGLRMPLL